jgi:hypothetical protein
MTIKRNGEKVILKGGKVSCSCCEEPEECCMYPADRLGVDYQAEDLPDSLAISDVEQGDFSGEWEKSDSGYQRDGYTLSVVNGQWVIEGFTRTITVGLCLIADVAQATILDQFADTYTVAYGPIQFVNSGNLQRTSLCVWDTGPCEWLGSFTQGWSAVMIYGDQTESVEEYRYKFRIVLNEPDPEGNCNGAGVFVKTGDQNSPAGTYSDGIQTLTVS